MFCRTAGDGVPVYLASGGETAAAVAGFYGG